MFIRSHVVCSNYAPVFVCFVSVDFMYEVSCTGPEIRDFTEGTCDVQMDDACVRPATVLLAQNDGFMASTSLLLDLLMTSFVPFFV